jgi:hypothetical protein
MQKRDKAHRGRQIARFAMLAMLVLLVVVVAGAKLMSPAPSQILADAPASGEALTATQVAEINFGDLARQSAVQAVPSDPTRVLMFNELEEPAEPGAGVGMSARPAAPEAVAPSPRLNAPSPSPTNNYQGLNDIPMADSSYIIIPPDVAGGVGPTKVMCSFNNNYRVQNKSTGATISTVGTATFWAPVTLASERLSQTDPRTTFDPYNNCWIACMQTVGANGVVLVGVSQTSDPNGAWWLYRFSGLSGSAGGVYQLDYPILGFNKNWVVVTINRYTSAGAFSYGIGLVLNYPQLRVGAGSGTLFTLSSGGASTHFCASPAWTYSASEESLFVVTHLGSAGATYAVDVISGTAAAPVYNLAAASNVRPGGGWVQPSGNIQPQAAPISGASACGATPCKIETSDAQVRQSPVYRNGFVWYAQTIGLPSAGLTHTAAQWTKITPSTTPAFVDGGRVEDPTATATNGGKWYDHTSLSVNANNDMIIGYTQFGSAQYPSAGYSFRYGTDPAGTIRDPLIYHAGEDYYHKTFSTATGRNRWGDFTTCQVDPCDDLTLWTLQEYGKTRTSTDDGNTGSNGSKWSTWWAQVGTPVRVASLTCPPDYTGAPGSGVSLQFRVTNGGAITDQFNYTVSDADGWGGPSSGTTPPLAPGGFFDVFVNFTIDPNCNPATDPVTFMATPVSAAGCYPPQQCNMTIHCDFATATLIERFGADPGQAGVDLTWSSTAVGQISAWNVYRATSASSEWTLLNATPIPMAQGGEFKYHDDTGAATGEYYYRLNAVMPNGSEMTMSQTHTTLGLPTSFAFAIAGPNPFAKGTAIRYAVPKAGPVRIDLYSITGQRVRTLVDRNEAPGTYTVSLSRDGGSNPLRPGVYMVRMTAGTFSKSLRLIGLN